MKYLEELNTGDCCLINGDYFIVTTDFKKNGHKLCINLKSGQGNLIQPDERVEEIDIFTFDKDSNIIAIKERKKEQ